MPPLLLDSLQIQGFRAFRDLRIDRLGRVNLIVGRNGSGKSSVLEALQVYSTEGQPAVLNSLLKARGEYAGAADSRLAVEHLFHGRTRPPENLPRITIGPVNRGECLSVSFEWYVEDEDEIGREISIPVDDLLNPPASALPGLVVRLANRLRRIVPLEDDLRLPKRSLDLRTSPETPCILLNPLGEASLGLGSMWDSVALTDTESDVVSCLRIIAPEVERVAVIGAGERSALVRLKNQPNPVPLGSLGAGMVRLLQVILALVNAHDGFLLVDEIENGIHYSVQADLWRVIFQVAQRLDVQVFATSHSLDCIQAFQQAAEEHPEEGVLIRLQHRKGEVEAVLFDEEKLRFATREQIEVRG